MEVAMTFGYRVCRRPGRLAVAGLSSLLLLLFGAGVARADILVYENSDQATFLGQVHKMKCKVKTLKSKKKIFRAGGKTTNGNYTLDIGILNFRGFGPDYNIAYGSLANTVDLEGVSNSDDFSNVFPFPGTPPNSAGTIAFAAKGAKVGVGAYGIPTQDYHRGVAIAGGAKCAYPK
jgi:hypothetical protein